MIENSKFSREAGNPLCTYMSSSAKYTENKQKERVWFMAGDPTAYGCEQVRLPKAAYDELRKSISNVDNHGYSDSVGDLKTREAVIKHFGGGKTLVPNDVIMVSGANHGLFYCLHALCESGDNILVPEFGYPFYEKVCPSLNMQARTYRLLKDHNFQVDLEHLKSLVDEKTKFIFVINPSNPMGAVFSQKHMQDIIKTADSLKLPIVADEVYYGQVFQGQPVISFGHITEEVPVIVVSGMQKIGGVPGWCTSWMILYDPCKHLQDVRQNFQKEASIFLHTNVFTQRALPGILDSINGANNSKRFMHIIKQNHDYLVNKFENYPCFKPYKAQGTFYITVEVLLDRLEGFASDIEFIKKLVEEENINLLPISIMGAKFHGFRMMTCATQKLYEEFFSRIDNFLTKHQKKTN